MASATPMSIDVTRGSGVQIIWSDGENSQYSLERLRSMCPCAKCKEQRAEKKSVKPLLTILPGNYSDDLAILAVDLVGNYALKITWSDDHDTGIYSFGYLRGLSE